MTQSTTAQALANELNEAFTEASIYSAHGWSFGNANAIASGNTVTVTEEDGIWMMQIACEDGVPVISKQLRDDDEAAYNEAADAAEWYEDWYTEMLDLVLGCLGDPVQPASCLTATIHDNFSEEAALLFVEVLSDYSHQIAATESGVCGTKTESAIHCTDQILVPETVPCAIGADAEDWL